MLISFRDIVLFARNTGEIYPTHCQMARDGASADKWFDHVLRTVMPLYCRQVGFAHALISDMRAAGGELRTYYTTHVQEA
jgi:hypothetical protein